MKHTIEIDLDKLKNFRLCYVDVDESMAFFTNQELCDQTGVDWHKAPFEITSSYPDTPFIQFSKEGIFLDPNDWNADHTPKWQILKVKFDCSDYHYVYPLVYDNTGVGYSVEEINSGEVAWFSFHEWNEELRKFVLIKQIFAGVNLENFINSLNSVGCDVFVGFNGYEPLPTPYPNIPMLPSIPLSDKQIETQS